MQIVWQARLQPGSRYLVLSRQLDGERVMTSVQNLNEFHCQKLERGALSARRSYIRIRLRGFDPESGTVGRLRVLLTPLPQINANLFYVIKETLS